MKAPRQHLKSQSVMQISIRADALPKGWKHWLKWEKILAFPRSRVDPFRLRLTTEERQSA